MEHYSGALDIHDFTDIALHLAQTPESFYSATPILYHRALSTSLLISRADLDFAPLLQPYAGLPISNGHGSAATQDATATDRDGDITISGVDIWVTSENLKLHFPTHNSGITIPYPAISLHAVQRSTEPGTPSSIYLQILKELGSYDDHDPESTLSLSLIPAPPRLSPLPPSSSPDTTPTAAINATPSEPPVQHLFTALTECANLHPDPLSDSDSEAERPAAAVPALQFGADIPGFGAALSSGTTALPPPLPGSGGWITAENVGDYFPEDGDVRNFGTGTRGLSGGGGDTGPLGDGAGSVRTRREDDDGDDDEGGSVNGEETKWRRTE